MAIVISDLNSEYNLLSDSESYLSEVTDAELSAAVGGITPTWGAYLLTTLVIGGTGAGFGALIYTLSHR
ncbi:hypothetical protein [Nostoc sp. CMAA1605]|uniref:hypothetical protein n=1 Tax=Nostoc sp. CMAA1605 TaxID=2055159 RepID=UPI001F32DE42|nr:hypothetical protein [Nostoc sp. CMAA1605]MCF4970617.1 hypothetical protein [Nostoc sp. CMAA1605]